MRAALLRGYGSNDRIEVGEAEKPSPAPDEVLVEVHAAGVNPLDFKTRQGALRLIRRFKMPLILGNELAGRVVGLGAAARGVAVGDEIFARVDKAAIGAFAEYARVKAAHLAKKPAGLSMTEAAAVPLAALTANQSLTRLGVGQGTKLLVHAGAGGVGSFALQLARCRGAFVATTASAKNSDLVKRLGADLVIDYRAKRFEDELGDYDAVFDTVGGETLSRSFRVLKRGGRVVSVAGPPEPGTARRDDMGAFVAALFWAASVKVRGQAKRAGVSYEYLFMRPDGEELSEIARLIEAGKVKPILDRAFPLASVREALAYLETGHATGKVVLTIR